MPVVSAAGSAVVPPAGPAVASPAGSAVVSAAGSAVVPPAGSAVAPPAGSPARSAAGSPGAASAAGLRVVSLADRPDLEAAMIDMEASWPEYIRPDPVLVTWAFERHARHQLVMLDGDQVVARAASVPFSWDGDPESLPDTGWDEVLRQCMLDSYAGAELTALCALEVAVVPGRRAQNLSGRTLAALAEHARHRGFADVVVPVRPSHKDAEPHLPMADYVARTRPDGLPADHWLRVHVRAGGEVLKVCPVSMTITGSLAQWRRWTGLAFDASGPVVVPGALTPVEVSVEHDRAVYIEPNVWVRHRLAPAAAPASPGIVRHSEDPRARKALR